MSQPQPFASRLVLLIVALAVAIVVVVKLAGQKPPAPAPPRADLARQAAVVSKEAPRTQPETPPAAPAKPSAPPAPASAAAPSATPSKPASEPTETPKVEPLPGPKLAECLQNGRPTFVDFGAGWCHACQQMEPVIHQLAADYQDTANVVYVDTDKYPSLAQSYRIRAIPAQFVFDAKGKQITSHIGYWPPDELAVALASAGFEK